MSAYETLLLIWREKRISTAAELAAEMNGNGVNFIYHNGKLENDQITYHDTREIFDRGGVTSYTGDIRTLFEIQNLCAGYRRFLEAFGKHEPLTDTFVKELHGILTQGTYDAHRYEIGERPGAYKLHDFVTGRDEVGALPEDVPQEMAELLNELQDVSDENALTAAAYFHAKLENIHPFADGNGRVGRLLMNYILVQHNHPPIIIFAEDRKEYYAALEKYDRDLELVPLVAFLKAQCEKSWSRYLDRRQTRDKHADLDKALTMTEQLTSATTEAEQRNAELSGKPSKNRNLDLSSPG